MNHYVLVCKMPHNRGSVVWVNPAETWSDLLRLRIVETELRSGDFAVFKIKGMDAETASQMARGVYKLKDDLVPDVKVLNTEVLSATLADFETQKDKIYAFNAWHDFYPATTIAQVDGVVGEVSGAD